jgi:hypothetical protein
MKVLIGFIVCVLDHLCKNYGIYFLGCSLTVTCWRKVFSLIVRNDTSWGKWFFRYIILIALLLCEAAVCAYTFDGKENSSG